MPEFSVVEQVAWEIRQRIRAGRLVPGQRLVEPDLTQSLGVSRVTVRDALRRLQAEGLVQMTNHRGARVRQMSRREVEELSGIRGALEGYAAGRAAGLADKPHLDQLQRLEEYWDSDGVGRAETYLDYNGRFHGLILDISGSEQVPRFVEMTALSIFRVQFERLLHTEERIQLSQTEHRSIVAAICVGDASAAERAMRKHIESSTRIILSAPNEYFL